MPPFRYGMVVSGKEFCGREALIAELHELWDNGLNVVLQGERRVGKTSLIKEAIERKKCRALVIDVSRAKSSDDLVRKILIAILVMARQGKLWERLLTTLPFLRLKPQLGIDPLTQLPSVSFDAGVKLAADSIPEVMALIASLHREKPLVVVFDEFQDVLDCSDSEQVLAELRGQIQHHAEIPYVFAGSIRNKMDAIFYDPASPMYKMAKPIDVAPLTFEEFRPFLVKKFKSGKRPVDDAVLTTIFAITDGITGDVQQFCEAFWNVTKEGEAITPAHLLPAIRMVFSREKKSYDDIMDNLTGNQVKVLHAVAALGGRNVFSNDFIKQTGLAGTTYIQQSLESMRKKKVIYKAGDEWRFANPFFRAWLLYQNTLVGEFSAILPVPRLKASGRVAGGDE